MTVQVKIERLVNKIVDEALQDSVEGRGITFQDRVDALKVITPYYVALRKGGSVEADADSTMADFAEAMKESKNGTPRVPGHRGRQ